jgi:hypothetical protein
MAYRAGQAIERVPKAGPGQVRLQPVCASVESARKAAEGATKIPRKAPSVQHHQRVVQSPQVSPVARRPLNAKQAPIGAPPVVCLTARVAANAFFERRAAPLQAFQQECADARAFTGVLLFFLFRHRPPSS